MAVMLLRWIVFLPAAAVLIALAQFATVTAAESFSWWVSAPLIIFFGALIAFAGLLPTQIAPNPRLAAIILIVLFVALEVASLVAAFPEAETYPFIMRIYADTVVVCGAVAGGFYVERPAA
jgi:hypothetical protein